MGSWIHTLAFLSQGMHALITLYMRGLIAFKITYMYLETGVAIINISAFIFQKAYMCILHVWYFQRIFKNNFRGKNVQTSVQKIPYCIVPEFSDR